MERFAVKDFSLGVIIPNIENEIYCSDYFVYGEFDDHFSLLLVKKDSIFEKGYQRFVGSFSVTKIAQKKTEHSMIYCVIVKFLF